MDAKQAPRIYNFFKAWNRLESRARKTDFSRTLKAEVHDALWMLTRQWQFGEFKGEDAASAINATMQIQTNKISRFKNGDNPAVAYNDNIPLETRVERLPIIFDYKTRVKIGKYWLKLVDYHGQKYNETKQTDGIEYELEMYKQPSFNSFSINYPKIEDGDTENEKILKSIEISDKKAYQFLNVIKGKVLDGVKLYNFMINSDKSGLNEKLSIITPHQQFIDSARSDFIAWFETLYSIPADENDSSWDKNCMEYNFSCSMPDQKDKNENITSRTVLTADGHSHGHLDWYSFNIEDNIGNNDTLIIPDETKHPSLLEAENIKTKIISHIPSDLSFKGMPKSRWWEFEDGSVNFGDIDAGPTDIAKTVLLEFALSYSNDWMCIPYPVPVGSLSEVKGLVVTNVFGERTWIEPAGLDEEENWMRWNMFTLTSNDYLTTNKSVKNADIRLFVPPAINKAMESAPIEKIYFLRDEMSNLVWSIEKEVPSMLGKSLNGKDAAFDYTQQLMKLNTDVAVNEKNEGNNEMVIEENKIELEYTLGNPIPANWIPFIPVKKEADYNKLILQRASFPMLIDSIDPKSVFRPRTTILRDGINENNQVEEHLLIDEEEIPKIGVFVSSSYQRTRWYNGKTYTWFGRQKKTGKSKGSVDLKFDVLDDLREK